MEGFAGESTRGLRPSLLPNAAGHRCRWLRAQVATGAVVYRRRWPLVASLLDAWPCAYRQRLAPSLKNFSGLLRKVQKAVP